MDGTTPRRSRPSISAIAAIALAGLQGICAIVILGLVGVRFGRASFSAAVFSIVLSVLTLLTSLFFGYLALRATDKRTVILGSFVWQGILVILWAAAAGTLGSHGNRSRSTGLRAAMALALILMVSFIAGTAVQGFSLWRGRRAQKKMTGAV